MRRPLQELESIDNLNYFKRFFAMTHLRKFSVWLRKKFEYENTGGLFMNDWKTSAQHRRNYKKNFAETCKYTMQNFGRMMQKFTMDKLLNSQRLGFRYSYFLHYR